MSLPFVPLLAALLSSSTPTPTPALSARDTVPAAARDTTKKREYRLPYVPGRTTPHRWDQPNPTAGAPDAAPKPALRPDSAQRRTGCYQSRAIHKNGKVIIMKGAHRPTGTCG